MKEQHLHTGHRSRLKSKFQRVGLDGFEDHEVLEFLLTFAIPQRDVNPLAHQLIKEFGSLNAVLDAKASDLVNVSGVGQHAASLLTLIPQLAKRYLDNPARLNSISLAHSEDRKEFFIPKFVGATEEQMYAAFLNKNWEVISCDMICKGSVDALRVEVRNLLDAAMRRRAAVVILAHNHFAHPEPSTEDVLTTQSVSKKLAACGIVLADHIVVCGKQATSMSATGQIRHV